MAAQNIIIAGAQYSGVPSITLNKTGGGTASFVDTSDADAVAGDIAAGKTAYVDGEKVVGTGSGGGGAWPPATIRAGDTPIMMNALTDINSGTSSLTATGIRLTMEKAGTYRFKWQACNTSSTGSAYTRLYKGRTAVGTQKTIRTATSDICTEDLTVAAGDTIEIYSRSASSLFKVVTGPLVACINGDNGF